MTLRALLVLSVASGFVGAQRPKLERQIEAMRKQGYRMLLAQLDRRDDPAEREDYREAGFRNASAEEPAGHWVWSRPYWFVWRDKSMPRKSRAWGPEQATGKPNSQAGTDDKSAWASKAPDAGREWLLLEYERPVLATRVEIHETLSPGAIRRVLVYSLRGREIVAYEADGKQPSRKSNVLKVPLVPGQRTMRLKIELDARRVAGWNEIDAVGLVDNRDVTHWAESAEASSYYHPGKAIVVAPKVAKVKVAKVRVVGGKPAKPKPLDAAKARQLALEKRIAVLEARNARLAAEVDALKRKLAALEKKRRRAPGSPGK